MCCSVRGWISRTSFVADGSRSHHAEELGESSPHSARPRASYARLRLWRVVCLRNANDIAFRVGELSEDDHIRDLGDGHHCLAALSLDLVEVSLRIVDLNIEGHLIAAAVSGADPAADALAGVV